MATPNGTSRSEEVLTFDGFLFDLDGTVVDSTEAIVKHWQKIGKQLNVDPAVILETSHGRRSIDTLQVYDPTKANWEYVSHIEGLIPREFGSSARLIPGSQSLLSSLTAASVPWGIVTSGTRALATGWLEVLHVAHPEHLVVAEMVERGKPDPACYLMGREKLGLNGGGKRVLVLEDAPAGIRAGKAAGCVVVGLLTTHGREEVVRAGADWVVEDLKGVELLGRDEGGGWKIAVKGTRYKKDG